MEVSAKQDRWKQVSTVISFLLGIVEQCLCDACFVGDCKRCQSYGKVALVDASGVVFEMQTSLLLISESKLVCPAAAMFIVTSCLVVSGLSRRKRS